MQQVLVWLILIEIIGIVSFLITFRNFHALNDRGFAISKIIGLSTLSLLSWLISVTNIIPRTTLTLYIILIILTIPAIMLSYYQKHEIKIFILSNWKAISWLQSLYLIFFFIFIIIRYYDPLITHTEQPMDLAFLSASMVTNSGVPFDPWLKGEPINYYYFGYWIFSDISKLSFLVPEISYNLAISTVPALLAVSSAGLAFNVIKEIKSRFWIGTIAALFSCFLSNTYSVLAWLSENLISSKNFWNSICIEGLKKSEFSEYLVWYPTQFWWWFNSTRIINFFGPNCDKNGSDYTITETPFFSYLLGDLHPHVMGAPFVIAFITICLLLTKINISKINIHSISLITFTTLLLTISSFINMWNTPILISILFMSFVVRKIYQPNIPIIRLFIFPTTITLISFLIMTPYILNLGNSITGIYASHTHTSLKHGLIIWLPLWIIIVPYMIKDFLTSQINRNIKHVIFVSVIITLVPWLIKVLSPLKSIPDGPSLLEFVVPVSLMVFISIFVATNHTIKKGLNEDSIFTYLIGLGFLLVLIPELFYIGDIFENRMNTIFKFYYQAWILFSLGAAYNLKKMFELMQKKRSFKIDLIIKTWMMLSLIGILSGLYFVPTSIKSKLEDSEFRSLNGLIDLKEKKPDIYQAIIFIRNQTNPKDGILEATGEWDESGMFSRTTGIQNIINWPGHQIQWRGSLDELSIRNSDVETIYKTYNNQLAKDKLNFYSIKYGVIGPNEIVKYGNKIGQTFNDIGYVIFETPTIKIYEFNN